MKLASHWRKVSIRMFLTRRADLHNAIRLCGMLPDCTVEQPLLGVVAVDIVTTRTPEQVKAELRAQLEGWMQVELVQEAA